MEKSDNFLNNQNYVLSDKLKKGILTKHINKKYWVIYPMAFFLFIITLFIWIYDSFSRYSFKNYHIKISHIFIIIFFIFIIYFMWRHYRNIKNLTIYRLNFNKYDFYEITQNWPSNFYIFLNTRVKSFLEPFLENIKYNYNKK